MRVLLATGPLEGRVKQVSAKPGPLIYVEVHGKEVMRFFAKPKRGRLPYLQSPKSWSDDRNTVTYTLASMTHRRCSGCDAIHGVVADNKCTTCGKKLVPLC